jgi:NhaP-type Na+/H+ or K+/H+ antiporter
MSIYDNGYQFAWEIWVGLAIGIALLVWGMRVSRKADRRHALRMQAAHEATKTQASKMQSAKPRTGTTSSVKDNR